MDRNTKLNAHINADRTYLRNETGKPRSDYEMTELWLSLWEVFDHRRPPRRHSFSNSGIHHRHRSQEQAPDHSTPVGDGLDEPVFSHKYWLRAQTLLSES